MLFWQFFVKIKSYIVKETLIVTSYFNTFFISIIIKNGKYPKISNINNLMVQKSIIEKYSFLVIFIKILWT